MVAFATAWRINDPPRKEIQFIGVWNENNCRRYFTWNDRDDIGECSRMGFDTQICQTFGQVRGQEVLASFYSLSGRTASGERFIANGNTAAARTWPIGTSLTVTNPANGQSVVVRINDSGPWGRAYQMGVRLDLARGAAQRIGMRSTQYVCVS